MTNIENAVQIDLDGYTPVININIDLISTDNMRLSVVLGAMYEVLGKLNAIRLKSLAEQYVKQEIRNEKIWFDEDVYSYIKNKKENENEKDIL